MLVEVLFYVFGTFLVLAALGVITSRNPVYSALSLVVCFITSAAIWLLIEAEFLAVVLVLVYVGAVMVLFLFVVMMLDINIEELRKGFTRFAWLGWLTAAALIVEIVGVVWVKGLGIDVVHDQVEVSVIVQVGIGRTTGHRRQVDTCGGGGIGERIVVMIEIKIVA